MLNQVGLTLFGSLRSKAMLMMLWFFMVNFVRMIGWVMIADEAADRSRRVSPAVIDARRNLSGVCARWYPVVLDLHRFFIAISRAVVIMMVLVVLLLILLFGLLVLFVRDVGWFMRFVTVLFYQVHLAFGVLIGFRFQLLLLVLRMLLFGLIPQVFWLNGSLF